MNSPANPTVTVAGPGEVVLETRDVPVPGAGQVVVKTEVSLISPGTELTLLDDASTGETWQELRDFPRQLGYSNVGKVVALGADVDPAWRGRRVHNHGPHQAYALAPAAKLSRVPDTVDSETATFTTLAKVAMNGLRRGQAAWGETVLVTGLGIVGQLSARLCEVAGLRPVYGADLLAGRRAKLPTGGPYRPLSGDEQKWAEQIRSDPGRDSGSNRGVDLVIEASGNPALIDGATRVLRDFGRLVMVSSPRGASHFDFHDGCNRRSLSIIGAHSSLHPPNGCPQHPWTSARHGRLFLELLETGRLDIAPLITHRFPATEAATAYRQLQRRSEDTLGVILQWQT